MVAVGGQLQSIIAMTAAPTAMTPSRGGLVVGLAVTIVMSLALSARAATTFYTNEAAFVANLAPGSYVENFDGYTYGSYQGATLSLSGGNSFAYTISATPGISTLYSADGGMSTEEANDALLVTFTGAPVYAVGGYFFASDIDGFYAPGSIVITLNDGSTQTNSPPNVTTFAGFISTVPITTITIDAPNTVDGFFWPVMDHFYVGALAFRITDIVRQGNNLLIQWRARGGSTNQVQATNGGAGGSYSNNFVNLSPMIFVVGTGSVTTNFLDVGGATNTPARYYRVRSN